MDFESFLYFVLALDNKDSPEGITYLFKCLDLNGRGFLTTAVIHTLFRDVHQKWIEGGNYELCIEDVRDEIWDMVKPADLLRITLSDLLSCKQGGTVASMLEDVHGFWAHDNRENLYNKRKNQKKNKFCVSAFVTLTKHINISVLLFKNTVCILCKGRRYLVVLNGFTYFCEPEAEQQFTLVPLG